MTTSIVLGQGDLLVLPPLLPLVWRWLPLSPSGFQIVYISCSSRTQYYSTELVGQGDPLVLLAVLPLFGRWRPLSSADSQPVHIDYINLFLDC